jgi:mono/diheme cytochrome c family protein
MKFFVKACVVLLCGVGLWASQEKPATKPAAASSAAAGQVIYKQHCAVCHGNDLKGNGPAPPPFEQDTPDLTTLARRHKEFPDAYVANVLRNGVKIPAHGPAEMPIWGTAFREAEELNEAQATERIASLISYIKSKQQK